MRAFNQSEWVLPTCRLHPLSSADCDERLQPIRMGLHTVYYIHYHQLIVMRAFNQSEWVYIPVDYIQYYRLIVIKAFNQSERVYIQYL